ncbi:MAG: cytochrome o ubiquinol oxidase subunit IV [Chlamydiia bacterium]
MDDHTHTTSSEDHAEYGSLKAYLWGFGLCLILTLASFFVVQQHLFTPVALFAVIAGLALIQAAVQVIFFLHLGSEEAPRSKLMVFLFMVMVLAILVGGSLWIVYNLEYRTMSGMDMG